MTASLPIHSSAAFLQRFGRFSPSIVLRVPGISLGRVAYRCHPNVVGITSARFAFARLVAPPSGRPPRRAIDSCLSHPRAWRGVFRACPKKGGSCRERFVGQEGTVVLRDWLHNCFALEQETGVKWLFYLSPRAADGQISEHRVCRIIREAFLAIHLRRSLAQIHAVDAR